MKHQCMNDEKRPYFWTRHWPWKYSFKARSKQQKETFKCLQHVVFFDGLRKLELTQVCCTLCSDTAMWTEWVASHTHQWNFLSWYKYFLTGQYLLKIIYYRQNVTPSKIPLKDFFRGYVSIIEHFSHPFYRSDMSTLISLCIITPFQSAKYELFFLTFNMVHGGQIKSQ